MRNYDIFVAKTLNYDIFVAKIYDYALIDSFWGFPRFIDSPTGYATLTRTLQSFKIFVQNFQQNTILCQWFSLHLDGSTTLPKFIWKVVLWKLNHLKGAADNQGSGKKVKVLSLWLASRVITLGGGEANNGQTSSTRSRTCFHLKAQAWLTLTKNIQSLC